MTLNIHDETQNAQPSFARLGIDPDGTRVVRAAGDVIAVDLGELNRLLAAEVDMLRRRNKVPSGVEPVPLIETAEGRLVLDEHHTYRLVRRDRHHPNVAIYQRDR